MAVVKANSSDIDLLARLFRAEGEGDCPPTWYDQSHTGRFKLHCFYDLQCILIYSFTID